MEALVVACLLELIASAEVHHIEDSRGVELHREDLQHKSEQTPKRSISREEMAARCLIYCLVVGQQVPPEHDARPYQPTPHDKNEVGTFLLPSCYLARICQCILAELTELPIDLAEFEVAKHRSADVDDQEDATHQHPVRDLAVVAEDVVCVFDGAPLAKRDEEPEGHVDQLEQVHGPRDPLVGLLLFPVEETEDVKNVDADPDEEVADSGQHKEFFKDQVVDPQHESLPHRQLVQEFVFPRQFVVAFTTYRLVAPPEHQEHRYTQESFEEAKTADEPALATVKDGAV